MDTKLFVATKAFIKFEGKILIIREAASYTDGSNKARYDVPGGRVKPGERFDVGLLREIAEETKLQVVVGEPFFVNEWRPIVHGEQWQIVGTFFECRAKDPQVTLSEDHDEYEWINPKEYKKYALIDNLKPAFEAYNNRFHGFKAI